MHEIEKLQREYIETQGRWNELFAELQKSPRDLNNIPVMDSDVLGRWVSLGKTLDRLSSEIREKALDYYGYAPDHPLRRLG